MKNSLVIVSVLFIQAFLSTSSALASFEPYLEEIRHYQATLETQRICISRDHFVLKDRDSRESKALELIAIASK